MPACGLKAHRGGEARSVECWGEGGMGSRLEHREGSGPSLPGSGRGWKRGRGSIIFSVVDSSFGSAVGCSLQDVAHYTLVSRYLQAP